MSSQVPETQGPPAIASGRFASSAPRISRRRLGAGAGVALGLMALAYGVICGYMALAITKPERQPFRVFPEQYGLAYESVQFPSRVDAIPLDGWLLLPASPD